MGRKELRHTEDGPIWVHRQFPDWRSPAARAARRLRRLRRKSVPGASMRAFARFTAKNEEAPHVAADAADWLKRKGIRP